MAKNPMLLVLVVFALACTLSLGLPSWYNVTGHLLDGVLTEQWIPLSQSEALNYYTAHEVCSLTHQIGCDDEPGALQDCSIHEWGVISTGRPCSNNQGSFMRHESTQPWPHSKMLADLIRLMRRQGSNTLFLVGDSITSQHFSDAVCSSRRAGFQIKRYKKQKTYEFIDDGFEILPQLVPLDEDEQKAIEKEYTMNSVSPPFFQVLLIAYCRDEPTLEQVEETVTKLLSDEDLVRGKATFIINTGLHFATFGSEIYEKYLTSFLEYFLKLAKDDHVVIFRETSAQHFQTSTGAYDKSIKKKALEDDVTLVSPISLVAERAGIFSSNQTSLVKQLAGNRHVILPQERPNLNYRCAPLKGMEAVEAQNWHNKLMADTLRKIDPNQHIGIAPFFHLTAGRHDYHVAQNRDCTHWCFGNLLWAPVWDFSVKYYRSKIGEKRKSSENNGGGRGRRHKGESERTGRSKGNEGGEDEERKSVEKEHFRQLKSKKKRSGGGRKGGKGKSGKGRRDE